MGGRSRLSSRFVVSYKTGTGQKVFPIFLDAAKLFNAHHKFSRDASAHAQN
jgi:hypothetical protein